MAVTRLTQRSIAAASCPEGVSDAVFWDDVLTGFGLRVRRSGFKTWIVQYVRLGRKERYTIGPAHLIDPADARARAKTALQLVLEGGDPAEETKARRASNDTVADLADLLLKSKQGKPAHETYKSVIDNHIKPLLGRLPVRSVTEAHCADAIEKVQHGHDASPTLADNRRLAGGASIASLAYGVLSAMFTLAETRKVKMRPKGTNPLAELERPETAPRSTVLSLDQYRLVGAALAKRAHERSAPAGALMAIWLLALSGLRHNEVRLASKAHADPKRQAVFLEATKTGDRFAILGRVPTALIAARLKSAAPEDTWLIPPIAGNASPPDIQRTWHQIRTEVGLPKVRLHDLRHSFSTIGLDLYIPTPIIKGLLGHAMEGVGGARGEKVKGVRGATAVYLHLRQAGAIAAADRISDVIWQAMGGGDFVVDGLDLPEQELIPPPGAGGARPGGR